MAQGQDYRTIVSVSSITRKARPVRRDVPLSSKPEDALHFEVPAPSAQLARMARGLRQDLGNILTPIVAFGEMLGEDPKLDEQSKDDVTAINEAAVRANNLVDTLLVAAGLSPVEHVQLSVLDLAELLEEAGASSPIHARFILSSGKGKTHSPDQMDLIVAADVRLLNRVVKELFENSFTMGAKNILVSVGIEDEYAVIRVSDDGPGVAKDFLSIMSEPYVSTQNSLARGLGLSVVNGIAFSLGGKLTLETDPSVGGLIAEISWPAAGVDEEIVIPQYLLESAELDEDGLHEGARVSS